MAYRSKQVLSKQEAIQLHNESLVIDSQQPPITSGALFTENMKKALDDWFKEGMTRAEARGLLSNMMADEIQNDQDARNQYVDTWDKSGVNVAENNNSPWDNASDDASPETIFCAMANISLLGFFSITVVIYLR